jgi:hypothetical protein
MKYTIKDISILNNDSIINPFLGHILITNVINNFT